MQRDLVADRDFLSPNNDLDVRGRDDPDQIHDCSRDADRHVRLPLGNEALSLMKRRSTTWLPMQTVQSSNLVLNPCARAVLIISPPVFIIPPFS